MWFQQLRERERERERERDFVALTPEYIERPCMPSSYNQNRYIYSLADILHAIIY